MLCLLVLNNLVVEGVEWRFALSRSLLLLLRSLLFDGLFGLIRVLRAVVQAARGVAEAVRWGELALQRGDAHQSEGGLRLCLLRRVEHGGLRRTCLATGLRSLVQCAAWFPGLRSAWLCGWASCRLRVFALRLAASLASSRRGRLYFLSLNDSTLLKLGWHCGCFVHLLLGCSPTYILFNLLLLDNHSSIFALSL